MDAISQKLAFLIEMFEDTDTSFVEKLVSDHPNYSLEQLVNECLNVNESQNKIKEDDESKQDQLNNEEYAAMISLIGASTAQYFKSSDTQNNDDNDSDIEILDLDNHHRNNSIFNTLPTNFKQYFDQYPDNQNRGKLMEIYTHISLMNEQHKLKYENNKHSHYNKMKMTELNGCISMIHKLMKNIVKSPQIEKYRRIRENNKTFQQKIASIDGYQLLLKLCGFDYIQQTAENQGDGLFVYNSALSTQFIQMTAHFLQFYMQQTTAQQQLKKINDDIPIITEFPRKRKQPKNVKTGQLKKKKRPKPNILSADALRQQRLKNLGNINSANYGLVSSENTNIGPIADKIMDLNAPNLRKEMMKIAKKKHVKWLNHRKGRKRVFTMADIEQLRKKEFDRNTSGPKVANDMDAIGKKALELTNEFRKQNGLPPCTWHQALCEIGKVHSKNMSDGKVPFGHQGFDARVKAYPFNARSAAENVAMSRGLSNVAKVAVDGWIDSPGHRKNLLSNNNYCGIGVYRGYNGAYYLTQLFGLH